MSASVSKSLIFVVISVLVVALVYSSFTPFIVFAAVTRGPIDCKEGWHEGVTTCCQTETDDEGIEIKWCVDCDVAFPSPEGSQCGPRYQASVPPTAGENIVPGVTGGLEQSPRPPSFDPTAPLQEGVLEQQEQQEPPTPPTFAPGASPGVLAPFVPGFLERQQQPPPADQGAAELPPPPATEGTQPATEQPLPVCQEGLEFNEDLGFCVPEDCPQGQVLDEQTGVCVLEEPEVATEEEPEEQEQQQSEEGDNLQDNSNNDNN